MINKRGTKSGQQREAQQHEAQSEMGTTELHSPRKPTATENVVMTIKILVGFGLIGAALWAMNLWVAPQ